ncbi:LytTR family DNA-binding domain-containing protein [Vineibacter terrae]|uniref:LytR/AlgR family response regulator transcription factor n=1 Tax=Vineibacter terrae TaxID=2586908 RepID=UPI002E369366|nr:LytTR family DNA-binding domain-containing protein [Vineibacter terrae]HEX2885921.1 LytTR family DNA-binding domain-containing protein [Vineibacter terrae]
MADDLSATTGDAPPSGWRHLGAALRRHRLVLLWAAILVAVTIIAVATVSADAHRHGRNPDIAWITVLEGTSHLVLGALVPLVYWFHRRFPVIPVSPTVLAHVALTVPFSLLHVLGMFVLRWLAAPLFGRAYPIQLDISTLLYEYRKDAVTYLIFSAALLALRYAFAQPQETTAPAAAAQPTPPADPASAPTEAPAAADTPAAPLLERFAVRRKDKEVLVSAADIAWIEAAGNYAILHVGGETYDIRSSLARLEAELDPQRFVRVHKSYIVNVARVREVEPWINGDSRLKLDDGAVVSLSRRYRPRFEKVVPVRT